YLSRGRRAPRPAPLDWPPFVKKLFASDFEAMVVGWTNHHAPAPFAYTIWPSSQWKGRNYGHYKNAKADEALEAARRTANQAERKKHYAEFSRILMEDAPYVFLYFPQQIYVTRQGYEGLVPIPTYAGIYQALRAVRCTGKGPARTREVWGDARATTSIGGTVDEVAYLGIAQLAPRLARRELSPVELCRALLARCERLEPHLNAFITLDPE